ncbi:MAG TPA: DegT/DnrJ/EryC1/StrS family aminotransferase [Solirubrobacteraceae bacterium]|nr:DegT/DnrJ/EryC1/StrS family aminotransferase [Solirubrobacteraceae bacterium]
MTNSLAMLGGAPASAPAEPHYPLFTATALERVAQLLQKGPVVGLSRDHPQVDAAEAAVADWHGVRRCLTTSSGHAALHAALIGLEITGGAEVITTPYTWGASVSPILHNDAVPVFADVDPEHGLLDPASVEAAVGPRTEAILAVHLYGQPADMTSLRKIADRHDLALIEDGSQAHGARHRGIRIGGFGDVAGFSCMGGKLLATTEAGYLITNREDVYWKAVISCQHVGNTAHPGRASEPDFPQPLLPYIDSLNYTHRVSTVNALLMVEQLGKLDQENAARQRNRAQLLKLIDGVGSVAAPIYRPEDAPVFHMLSLNFVPEHAGISKQTYLAALKAEGVPIFNYVAVPLHKLERLRADTAAPKVMWTERIRGAGIDYGSLELPGCERKVQRSIEMLWNWIEDDLDAMRMLADCFIKVEEHLDQLRAYERRS